MDIKKGSGFAWSFLFLQDLIKPVSNAVVLLNKNSAFVI